MTAASGRAIRVENDDVTHGDQLYADSAHAEIYADATGAIITMAGTAAVQDLGNTNATGNDLANSVTAVGVTVSLTAGTFTVTNGGTYRLYLCGSVTGEEDEDVTLEWAKNGTALGEPHEVLIEFDAATGVSALNQHISQQSLVELDAGDYVTLSVLGSNSEVITFKRFNFGLELVKSAAYD